MAFMNKEGNVLDRYPLVYNSWKGFEFFTNAIDEVKGKNGFNKVIIGMVQALESELHLTFSKLKYNPQMIGALDAAILAQKEP